MRRPAAWPDANVLGGEKHQPAKRSEKHWKTPLKDLKRDDDDDDDDEEEEEEAEEEAEEEEDDDDDDNMMMMMMMMRRRRRRRRRMMMMMMMMMGDGECCHEILMRVSNEQANRISWAFSCNKNPRRLFFPTQSHCF